MRHLGQVDPRRHTPAPPRLAACLGVIVALGLLLPTGAISTGVASGHPSQGRSVALATGGTLTRKEAQTPSGFTFPLALSGSSAIGLTPATVASSEANLLLPGPFRSTYGVDQLLNRSSGTPDFPVGKALAVLAWGWGYDPTDLQTFWNTYYPSNFPLPKVIAEPIDGAPPPGINSPLDPSGGSRELTIDVEWLASMAPGATIYVVYAPPGPGPSYSPTYGAILDALNWTLTLGNLTALSMSFGEPQGENATLEGSMNTDFRELEAEGTTVLAASGDDGGAANSPPGTVCRNGPAVNFPAASPYVVAVGGTNATSSGAEPAWDLSGGGPSSLASDPAPSWQSLGSSAGFAASLNEREVPDVSASAVDDAYYFGAVLRTANGTSFASPMWAGIVADVATANGGGLGVLDPSLYALGALQESGGLTLDPFQGASTGGSCFYRAKPGWNQVAGWGAPSALDLALDLQGASFEPLTISVNPSQDVSTGSVVTVTVSMPTTDLGTLAGEPLTLSVLASTNDSPVLRIFGTVPSPSAPAFSGTFTLPGSLDQAWVNVTAYAQSGTTWAVGTTVLTEPPPPAASGPSVLTLLLEYQLPILVGFLVLLLVFRIVGDRRRKETLGPTPNEVSGRAPATSDPLAPAGAPSTPTTSTEAMRGSAAMSPFCWKCGANLTGTEKQCPSCGTRFA